jgi:hypothetical protein
MKIKDFVLASLITANLLLVVLVAAIALGQSEPAAQAGAAVQRVGFKNICTLKHADDREGIAIIDTMTNRLSFYVNTEGRKEVKRMGDVIDLSAHFRHPK